MKKKSYIAPGFSIVEIAATEPIASSNPSVRFSTDGTYANESESILSNSRNGYYDDEEEEDLW